MTLTWYRPIGLALQWFHTLKFKNMKVNKRIVMRMSDFQWPEVVRKETFPLVKKLKLQFRCLRMFHNLLFLYLFLLLKLVGLLPILVRILRLRILLLRWRISEILFTLLWEIKTRYLFSLLLDQGDLPLHSRLHVVCHRTPVSHILVSCNPTIYLILFRSLMTGLWLMSPIFPKSVVLVLFFLMSISDLKIRISLTLLWVSWYPLVTLSSSIN